jgi:hypothetical protein
MKKKIFLVLIVVVVLFAMVGCDTIQTSTNKDVARTLAEKQGWGEQAKMRANKTAATYNAYILENTFVWKDNVPEDIKRELPIVK